MGICGRGVLCDSVMAERGRGRQYRDGGRSQKSLISQFLGCRLVTQIMQTSLAALRSASAETFNPPGTDQEKREFSDPVLSTSVPSSMTARRDAAELGDSIASP